MPEGFEIAALERALARLRAGESIDEESLRDLAFASFDAGRAAASTRDVSRRRDPGRGESREVAPPTLTPRRLEVLRLVARGLTNDEIGRVLGISRLTVKSHLASLFVSLEVTNRTEAAFALQRYESPVASPRD